jgi:hypothetical protein
LSYPDGIRVKAILKEPVVWRVPKVLGVEVICMVSDNMDDLAVGGGDGGVLAVREACPSTGSVDMQLPMVYVWGLAEWNAGRARLRAAPLICHMLSNKRNVA